MSHPAFALLAALLFSAAMAMLGHRAARERWYAGLYVFLACVVSTVAGGWLMFLIHG